MTTDAQPRSSKRLGLLLAAVLIVLAGAAGWRWVQSMPIGTGETRPSPDGKYTASIMDNFAEDFWTGRSRRWFTIRVEGPNVAYEYNGSPFPGPYFGSRSSVSVIHWSPDWSFVRFVFPTAEFRFETRFSGQ